MKSRQSEWAAVAILLLSFQVAQSGVVHAADGDSGAAAPGGWSYSFTTYAWTPWISGDLTIKGRSFDVDVTAGQVLDSFAVNDRIRIVKCDTLPAATSAVIGTITGALLRLSSWTNSSAPGPDPRFSAASNS